MTDKLTQRQEKFVQGLVAGLSQRKAYKEAYNAQKMADSTIDSRASKLLKEYKVNTRYRELLKEFSNRALWSREQAFNEYEWLKNKAKSEIIESGLRPSNFNAFLSALHGMNNSAFRDLELLDEKLRAEISVIKNKIQQETPVEDDKFIEAMTAMAEFVWKDENQKEKT